MIEVLKNKKVIFFDVGYTLDYPASGDWMFTKKFYEIVGDRLNRFSSVAIQKARELSLGYLEKNHLVKTTEEEYQQFTRFYSNISRYLNLSLTDEEVHIIVHDRTYNMNNYMIYGCKGSARVIIQIIYAWYYFRYLAKY